MYAAWLKVISSASKTSIGAGEQGGREVEVVLDYDLKIFEGLGKVEGKGRGRGGSKGKGGSKGEEVGEEAVVLGNCAACGQGGGILAVCKDDECGVSTHITCLAQRSLLDERSEGQGQGQILPLTARCPRCTGAMKWSDVACGVTGRIRGKGGKAAGEVVEGGKRGMVGGVGGGSAVGSIVENASASGSGLESGSESEADSWAGVVELE